MNKAFLLFVVMALVAACSNEADVAANGADSTAAGTSGEVVAGEAALASFYEYLENRDSAFSRSYFQEASPAQAIDTLGALPIDRGHLAPYDSFLIYNSPRSKAVDPYSHSFILKKGNGETTLSDGSPDTELALINRDKATRQRLFYFGPSYIFLDARWKDDATVLFVVSELIGTNKISPEIWEVDTDRFTKKVSRYPDTLTFNPAEYRLQRQSVLKN